MSSLPLKTMLWEIAKILVPALKDCLINSICSLVVWRLWKYPYWAIIVGMRFNTSSLDVHVTRCPLEGVTEVVLG